MKMRAALSLLTVVAVVALPIAAIGAGSPANDNPDVLEVRHYALTLDKATRTATAMETINKMVAALPA